MSRKGREWWFIAGKSRCLLISAGSGLPQALIMGLAIFELAGLGLGLGLLVLGLLVLGLLVLGLLVLGLRGSVHHLRPARC